ncbi:bifunctional aspartate kinase/homoserine dehydrogenase I [Ekhidna sp.]|uniref:bifunctional aspartate kinase/homoserine dehydrogenase I n=1 Tax=Ekhidna sp. TaxID=2608089 RepID=UPI0032995040
MKVLKFGGTSLGNEASIRQAKDIIFKNDSILVVVVSAVGKTTDDLNEAANFAKMGDSKYIDTFNQIHDLHVLLSERLCGKVLPELEEVFEKLLRVLEGVFLLKELTNRSLDFILGSGELLSSLIISNFLLAEGLSAKWFDSRKIILTDDQFGSANVHSFETDSNIKKAKHDFEVINVFAGFIAGTESHEITTLGRGGSDYTASLLAASLNAEIVEIWTDVNGIMTADPSKVKRSHTLDKVSYEEALELSHFGAKVIYAQSIAPVFKAGISVVVKNTFEPDMTGTFITSDENNNGSLIKGISSIDEVSVMSVSGNAALNKIDFFPRLFKVLADNQVEIIFMTHSNAEYTVTLGFKASEAKKALSFLKKEFRNKDESQVIHSEVLEEDYSLLALIGSKMKDQVGVSGKMFNVLGKNGISIKAISQGSSERNISAIIPKADLSKALNVLHESFFLSEMRRLNLFIIGAGNVGKAFLDQITGQFLFLKKHHHLNVKVIGVANSRKMAFQKDGIPLSKWQKYLDEGEVFSKEVFVETMNDVNFRNSIFIDITASEDISELYASILSQSISVVTPNKIAATRSFENYLELKAASRRYGSQFLIETNVCAGLPILSTLNDLIRSGDQVNKLEAVLSGTLNFLFNEYNGTISFADVIKKAKELGYSEPDPRLDISGEDVMRKLLILIRESTYEMEMDEIEITSFLPKSCTDSVDLDDFYHKIEQEEPYFKAIFEKAKAGNSRLKLVASFQNGKGRVALEEIPETHPFYQLEGKDNVVLFYTTRYAEQPLVIKGAGAGAEVTASGIFADVLRIAQSNN